MNDGWSVCVMGVDSSGRDVTRYFVVAVEDEAMALRAVLSLIGTKQRISHLTPVEARLLTLRHMRRGEVRQLGHGRTEPRERQTATAAR